MLRTKRPKTKAWPSQSLQQGRQVSTNALTEAHVARHANATPNPAKKVGVKRVTFQKKPLPLRERLTGVMRKKRWNFRKRPRLTGRKESGVCGPQVQVKERWET